MPAPLLKIKIITGKIDKSLLFTGKKHTYLDVALFENAAGTDEYGNDGFLVQETNKEQRDAGEKGAIIGNWKYLAKKQETAKRQAPKDKPKPPADPDLDAQPDDIPF